MNRNCAECGVEFKPKRDTQAFCSNHCKHKRLGRINSRTLDQKTNGRLVKTENGCIEWTGGRDKDGYGKLWHNGEERAHRVIWSSINGEIPEGMFVLHHCDNPPCCNIDHLFLGNNDDNMKDASSKGRLIGPRGEKSKNHKLTEDDVLRIRSLYATGQIKQRRLADVFPVGYKAINKIIHGQRWAHI